jgi:hypothetical protein
MKDAETSKKSKCTSAWYEKRKLKRKANKVKDPSEITEIPFPITKSSPSKKKDKKKNNTEEMSEYFDEKLDLKFKISDLDARSMFFDKSTVCGTYLSDYGEEEDDLLSEFSCASLGSPSKFNKQQIYLKDSNF